MSSRTGANSTYGRDAVEVMHSWGDGSELLEPIVDRFADRNPGTSVEMLNEANISLEVKVRILTENPPDVWASWVGPHLQPYHETGVLGDVTDVWTDSGMERAFHETAKEAVRFDGGYAGVPLNVQRTNTLIYNVDLLERASVDPARIGDPREFVEALEQIDDAVDAAPIVIGFVQPFASQGLYMWEGVYMGLHGPDAYRDLLNGNAGRRRSELASSLSVLNRILEIANDDAVQVSEDVENRRFVEGEGAIRMQGMWAGLGLTNSDMEYGTGWEMAGQPGAQDVYAINMDGLAVPATASNPENAAEFVRAAGSTEALDGFNRQKNTIPPRDDVSLDGYPAFIREQAEGFRRADDHLPSMAHGFAVPPETLIELEVCFADYVADRDPEATADELVTIFESQ